MKTNILLVGLFLTFLSCQKNQIKSSPNIKARYYTNVKPIIDNYCISCHGINAEIPMNSSEKVADLIQNGQLVNSLISDVNSNDAYLHIPPNVSLPGNKIDTILLWEESGFPD